MTFRSVNATLGHYKMWAVPARGGAGDVLKHGRSKAWIAKTKVGLTPEFVNILLVKILSCGIHKCHAAKIVFFNP